MNRRQAKKHFKKAMKLASFSLELAERYFARYRTNYLMRRIENDKRR